MSENVLFQISLEPVGITGDACARVCVCAHRPARSVNE